MQFEDVSIPGVRLVRAHRHGDNRGTFERLFCAREFAAAGLHGPVVQSNLATNRERGTLRGMHFQWPPSAEGKLVQCVRGALLDVALDLRPASATFGRHYAVELRAGDGLGLFIPHGCAHGYQTLADDTDVVYHMWDFHAPERETGVRWDDRAFGIAWPLDARHLSERDRGFADFDAERFRAEWRVRERPAASPAGGSA